MSLSFFFGIVWILDDVYLCVPSSYHCLAEFSSNRKNILVICLAFWSIMTAFMGLSRNYLELTFARMGQGLGEAGCTPLANSLISVSTSLGGGEPPLSVAFELTFVCYVIVFNLYVFCSSKGLSKIA